VTEHVGIVARHARWLALLLVTVSLACKSSPASPSSKSLLEGVWTGTIVDSSSGNGTLRLDMKTGQSQDPSYVTGTWKATFPSSTYEDTIEGGLVLQSSASGMLTAKCSFSPPLPVVNTTPITVFFVVVDNTRMTGNYQSPCNGFGSGSITLTKQ